jgi:hypothetical protein
MKKVLVDPWHGTAFSTRWLNPERCSGSAVRDSIEKVDYHDLVLFISTSALLLTASFSDLDEKVYRCTPA